MDRIRLSRRALSATVMAGMAGLLVALAPAAADAAVISGGAPRTLHPGDQICVGGSATSDAKGVGSADNPGVVYILSRGGVEVYRTSSRRTGAFQTPVVVGAGSYLFCAKNATGLGQDVTNVSVTLLTDGDA